MQKQAILAFDIHKKRNKNIEIINLKSGKINVLINGKSNKHMHCSISHTSEYATAVAVIEKL